MIALVLTVSNSDAGFHHRFGELMNRICGLSTQNRDIGSHGFHMDLFQR